MSEAPTRDVSDAGADDVVLPFAVEPLDLRGRVVRLGPSIDRILSRHGYPAPVARLLGEAAATTALLGTALKFEGRFQLQTRTDGVVDMLVVDFEAPDRLRAFARFDAARLQAATDAGHDDPTRLMGQGHLALTIDPGGDMARYQGVVKLDGETLEQAAHRYFAQSEQIPTVVRLAVAQNVTGAGDALARRRSDGAIPAGFAGAPAAGGIASRRRAGGGGGRRTCRRRRLGRSQGAGRHGGGSRTGRSDGVERAAALSPVP
jgi:molecular chaperone Hsp33